MSSVLDAIRTAWATTPELTALVPADRVYVGPPNPGIAAPCIGFVQERQSELVHTSAGQCLTVAITAVAEADSAETLERLADLLREKLHQWESTRFRSIRIANVAATIGREEQSPKRLWSGEIILTYEVQRR